MSKYLLFFLAVSAFGQGQVGGVQQGASGGGAISPVPIALTDGATISTNAALGNSFKVTLGGNRALAAPTNPTDGQKAMWIFVQDGTGSRTIALNSVFTFGTDVTGCVLSTTASKTDYLGAVYNAANTAWNVVSCAKGY